MMPLSKTTIYALTATLILATRRHEGPISAKSLALEGNMPERFLMQVLRSLVVARILKSTRGVVGGYTLEKDPEELSVLEIIEATAGQIALGGEECLKAIATPSSQGLTLALSNALDEASTSMRKKLSSVSLQSILLSNQQARLSA